MNSITANRLKDVWNRTRNIPIQYGLEEYRKILESIDRLGLSRSSDGELQERTARRIVTLDGTSLQIVSAGVGCTPAFDIKVPADTNQLVCVEVAVVESAGAGMLMSNDLCLESEKGDSYCVPDFLCHFSGMRVQGTGGGAAALDAHRAFTFYFQVPKAIPLSALRLTQKKPGK